MSLLYGAHRHDGRLDPAGGLRLVAAMAAKASASTTSAAGLLGSERAVPGGLAWGVWGRPALAALPGAGLGTFGSTVHLVAQCRLDNRADLLRKLDWPADDARPDVDLIAAAYSKYGADCVAHLVGDWAFALWDADRQRLMLARDATGNSALFWWQGGGQLLFSTRLQTLLAAGPVPRRPDPRWMAGLLTVFSDPAHPTATAFQDVHALPSGHLLLAERGAIAVKRWWRPEDLPPLDDCPLPELEARFLALYDDAVRQRLRRGGGSVAATLSGGLDSGSVVALAAPALAEQGQPLTAYVHTPRFEAGLTHASRTTNEWQLAQATARHVGNVQTVACPTEQMSPLDGIRQWLDIAAAPSQAASNWYWLLDIAQQASAGGAQVLLTGQGGNATVSFNGSGDLWPAMMALRWRHVWHELASEEAMGLTQTLLRRLIKPALRPGWHRLKAARVYAAERPPWSALALLNPRLANSIDLAGAMAANRHDASFISTSSEKMDRWRLGLYRGADNGSAVWATLGSAFHIDVSDPTRDQRLVELCWRLPDELFWSHGRQRGLIRSGMRDRLPEVVRDSTRKGLQSSDLPARLLACQGELLAEVDALSRHGLVCEWIDMPRLTLSVRSVLDGTVPAHHDAVDASSMLRALAAAMFIARHG